MTFQFINVIMTLLLSNLIDTNHFVSRNTVQPNKFELSHESLQVLFNTIPKINLISGPTVEAVSEVGADFTAASVRQLPPKRRFLQSNRIRFKVQQPLPQFRTAFQSMLNRFILFDMIVITAKTNIWLILSIFQTPFVMIKPNQPKSIFGLYYHSFIIIRYSLS